MKSLLLLLLSLSLSLFSGDRHKAVAARIIKGGKVIDNNRTHPFLTPFFVPLSGMHVSDRYLFSICRLRL